MAMEAHVGSFNITTGVADVVVTGTGFQPKAIIFWWSGRTESVDTVGRADIFSGFGAASGAAARGNITSMCDDGVAASSSYRGHYNDSCISRLTTAKALDGKADLKSFDSSGFTLAIDDDFSVDLRVSYLALGGNSITDALVGSFAAAQAPGNQDVEGLGFEPECVLLFNVYGDAASPLGNNWRLVIGAATSSAARFTAGVADEDGSGVTHSERYHYSGECTHLTTATGDSPTARADFVTFLADGFRINWLEGGNDAETYYLALKGGDYIVGDLLTQTNTTTEITESGLSFQPAAALFVSCNGPESAQDVQDDNGIISIGAFSDNATRNAQAMFDKDNVDDSECSAALETDAVYANIAADHTIDGLMDIKSVNSDGFTCIMDDADPAQCFVSYVAFGPAVSAPAGLVRIIGT